MIHGKTIKRNDKLIIIVYLLCLVLFLLSACKINIAREEDGNDSQIHTSLSEVDNISPALEGETTEVEIVEIGIYTYVTSEEKVFFAPYPILTQNGNTKLDVINDTIKVAFTEWLDDFCDWVSNATFSVVYHDDSLVTIEEEIIGAPRDGIVRLFCTIDMTTGERKLFSDFFEIDEELYNNFSTIKNDLGNNIWSTAERSDRVIEQLCMTEKEFLEWMRTKEGYSFAEASTWGLLRVKSCFYLSDNGIVVIPEGAFNTEIRRLKDGSFSLTD